MLTAFAPCSPAWLSATAHSLRASGGGAGGGLGAWAEPKAEGSGLGRGSGSGSREGERVSGAGLYAAFCCAISSSILSRILLKDVAVHLNG